MLSIDDRVGRDNFQNPHLPPCHNPSQTQNPPNLPSRADVLYGRPQRQNIFPISPIFPVLDFPGLDFLNLKLANIKAITRLYHGIKIQSNKKLAELRPIVPPLCSSIRNNINLRRAAKSSKHLVVIQLKLNLPILEIRLFEKSEQSVCYYFGKIYE